MINYSDMARMACWTTGSYLVLDGAGAMPSAQWPQLLSIIGLTLIGLAIIKR